MNKYFVASAFLFLIAIALTFCATNMSFSQQKPVETPKSMPEATKPNNPIEAKNCNRFQMISSTRQEDICLVIDTSTGRVWSYTKRYNVNYCWIDLGIPSEKASPAEGVHPP